MSWLSRLKNAVNSRRLEQELADEMRDHRERRAASLEAKGLSAAEARRQAELRFGSVTRIQEESRGIRLAAGLESTLKDLRYAGRAMRRSPAFSLTVVLSLGLAIGANTAIYSIVDAAILRPLPIYAPQELFRLSWMGPAEPGGPPAQERVSFSYPIYLQFAALTKSVARLTLFSYPMRVEAQGSDANAQVEKITRQYVSEDAFEVLGVYPSAGSLAMPKGQEVAVLSYDYWRRRFQANPSIIRKNITIDGKSFEITGITRKGFFGVEPGRFVDVWVPASLYDSRALVSLGWNWFQIVGRSKRGVTRERLQSLFQPVFHRAQLEEVKQFPMMPAPSRNQLLRSTLDVHDASTGVADFRRIFARPLWIVFAVAAGILLIACANVASLLLARSTARTSEMAMRVSLGAPRRRLIRQMMTESLVLSLLAGGLGWLLARAGAPLLVRLLSIESNPVQLALAIDTRVLLFCTGISALSAVLFGLVPAWQASRTQPMTSLRSASGQAGKLRLGKIFVTIQVACAFGLVMTGAAFLFSLGKLFRVNPGFDARNVAVLDITTEAGKKPEEAQRALMFELQRRVAGQTGVVNTALAAWPIFLNTGWDQRIILPGKGPSERQEIFYRVSPGYFATMRTPLLAGRDFQPGDSGPANPGPAIVNAAFARRYFGSLDVLGRNFAHQFGNSQLHKTIVGVASDAYYFDLRRGAEPIVYLPTEGSNGFTLYVRSPLSPGPLARLVERESQAVGSGMRAREVTTLETLVGNTLLREKLLAGVGGTFAFFGLLVAAVGLFGLLSYSVGRRTKEIGIRTALGARRKEVVWLVLKEAGGLVNGGLLIGFAGALAAINVFRSLLFEIRATDPFVIGTTVALFLVTGALAASLPAHRAAGVDPIRALREE